MRVSTATSSCSDSRVFTVVVQGYGLTQQRNAERSITVPFSRLQSLMQSISKLGGKVISVTAASEAPAAPAASPAPAAAKTPAAKAAPAKPAAAAVHHADVPVNLYKPKTPFIGTVTENYSLLAEGAI
ncbi:MAG: ferredoxin-NADP reductase, partial [Cyanobacteria bacterium M_surface_7_m2_037]|nr:ferredoxin-NADP reductase [Cyanobacteria bacterium M_surface_7_m2_037]